MAEERNLSLARTDAAAADEDSTDAATDATKAELQRRMDEARESITHTVTEIKETVMNQYQQVREQISDSLDWREQYRRRPVPFTVGAFGVGLVLGYSITNAVKGDRDDYDEEEYDTDASFDRIEQGFDRMSGASQRAYAAQPITGAHGVSSLAATAPRASDVGPEPRPAYAAAEAVRGGGYEASTSSTSAATAEPQEPQGPGLLERFKETRAYDRLQNELSTLGDRVVDELSKTAQTVVVPAILSKLKDLIGIDLSTQREVAQRSRLEHDAARAGAATAAAAEGQPSGQGAGTGGGAASAHATGGARA